MGSRLASSGHVLQVPYRYRAALSNDALAAVSMVVGFLKQKDWQSPPDQDWLRTTLQEAYAKTSDEARDATFCQLHMEQLLRYCGVPTARVRSSDPDFVTRIRDSVDKGLPVILACYDGEHSAVVVVGYSKSGTAPSLAIFDPRHYDIGAQPQHYPPRGFQGFASKVSPEPGNEYPLSLRRPAASGTSKSWIMFGLFVPETIDLRTSWAACTYHSAKDTVSGTSKRADELRQIAAHIGEGETWTYLPGITDPKGGLCALASSHPDSLTLLGARFRAPSDSEEIPVALPQMATEHYRPLAAPGNIQKLLDAISMRTAATNLSQSPSAISPPMRQSIIELYGLCGITTVSGWADLIHEIATQGRKDILYSELRNIVGFATLAQMDNDEDLTSQLSDTAGRLSEFGDAASLTYTGFARICRSRQMRAVALGNGPEATAWRRMWKHYDRLSDVLGKASFVIDTGMTLHDLNTIVARAGGQIEGYDNAIEDLWYAALYVDDPDIKWAIEKLRADLVEGRRDFVSQLADENSDIWRTLVSWSQGSLSTYLQEAMITTTGPAGLLATSAVGTLIFFQALNAVTGVEDIYPYAKAAAFSCVLEDTFHRVAFEKLRSSAAKAEQTDDSSLRAYAGAVRLTLFSEAYIYGKLKDAFHSARAMEGSEREDAAQKCLAAANAALGQAKSWTDPPAVARTTEAAWQRLWGEGPPAAPAPTQRRHSLARLCLGDPLQEGLDLYGLPQVSEPHVKSWRVHSDEGTYSLTVDLEAGGTIGGVFVSGSPGDRRGRSLPGNRDPLALEHLATGEGLRVGDPESRMRALLGEPSGTMRDVAGYELEFLYAFPKTEEYLTISLNEGVIVAMHLSRHPLEYWPGAPPGEESAVSKPPASPQAGDVWVNPKDGAEMVYVPAGEFLMGSTEAELSSLAERYGGGGYRAYMRKQLSNEELQHSVYLDGYWIHKHEVTVAHYRKFCQATGRPMPSKWADDRPIIMVSWNDAQAYAQWAGGALPTEAQWEKAARGADGRRYPWGDDWDWGRRCNDGMDHNSVGGRVWPWKTVAAPVGSYPTGTSPYGAMDMAGNVWEWCADWYRQDYYGISPASNPRGPATGSARVLRGGSYDHGERELRCAYRFYADPNRGYGGIGFRCVVNAKAGNG